MKSSMNPSQPPVLFSNLSVCVQELRNQTWLHLQFWAPLLHSLGGSVISLEVCWLSPCAPWPRQVPPTGTFFSASSLLKLSPPPSCPFAEAIWPFMYQNCPSADPLLKLSKSHSHTHTQTHTDTHTHTHTHTQGCKDTQDPSLHVVCKGRK